MCPACPVSDHSSHELVGFTGNISDDLRYEIAAEQASMLESFGQYAQHHHAVETDVTLQKVGDDTNTDTTGFTDDDTIREKQETIGNYADENVLEENTVRHDVEENTARNNVEENTTNDVEEITRPDDTNDNTE